MAAFCQNSAWLARASCWLWTRTRFCSGYMKRLALLWTTLVVFQMARCCTRCPLSCHVPDSMQLPGTGLSALKSASTCAYSCLPVQLFGIVFPDTVRQRHRQLQVRFCNSVSATPLEGSALHSCSHMQSPTRGESHSSKPDSASLHWSILRYVFLDLALPMRLFDIPAIKVCSLSRPGAVFSLTLWRSRLPLPFVPGPCCKGGAVSPPVQAGRFRACWNILVLAFFCRQLAQQRNNDSFSCYFAHTLSKELSAFLQSKVCRTALPVCSLILPVLAAIFISPMHCSRPSLQAPLSRQARL